MSLYDYRESQRISASDPPFYALIMACFRKADTHNLGKLRCAFPQAWLEFGLRYNAPGGRLEGEQFDKPQEYPDVPETIMGIPVKIVDPRPDWPSTLVLGSFNDYDHREKELDAEFRRQAAAKREELDGT